MIQTIEIPLLAELRLKFKAIVYKHLAPGGATGLNYFQTISQTLEAKPLRALRPKT